MKKKIIAAALSTAMLATVAISGTLAYFTDTDSEKNVMVTGNVSIIQNEHQRDEQGNLEVFKDDKPLYPATGDADNNGKIDAYKDELADKKFTNGNGEECQITDSGTGLEGVKAFSLDNNAVDKIVTVTNDGNNEAYIRTLFAFEVPVAPANFNGDKLNGEYIDIVNVDPYLYTVFETGLDGAQFTHPKNEDGSYVMYTETVIDEQGQPYEVAYLLAEYYYANESKLAAGTTSHPSMTQIYMSANATNEDAEFVVGEDGDYNILVLSQGVQTVGFTSAKEALDEAFGVVNDANVKEWFKTINDNKDAGETPVVPGP